MLCLYAVAFSFAYLSLSTGTGALILFGSVQVTMIAVALASGERPHALEWVGLAIALAGLVALVLPGLTAPPFLGAALMATAGFAWGLYSLLGRGAVDPLGETASNFLRSVPLAAAVSLLTLDQAHLSPRGIVLAVVSGALTSGLGYVVWFAALRGLTATRAATVQLAVPVLAALGGVVTLAETVSLRLALAALLILGGIGLAVAGRRRPPPPQAANTA
jgi:drug/metabolite transporter (DMT)-like permease